jgi:hypothetical protein
VKKNHNSAPKVTLVFPVDPSPTSAPLRFSPPEGGGGIGILGAVTARKPKAPPADASLATRVQATVDALETRPEHAGLVGLALLLARTIDGMDGEMRSRMLGQTSGQLLSVLRELGRVAAKPYSRWDGMAHGSLARRRTG